MTVTLRPISYADAHNLMTWVNDPAVVGKFATFSHPFTLEDEKQYVNRMKISNADRVFSIENQNSEYIGQAGLHEIDWANKSARAALLLRREFQGKGYGQDAINELLDEAFDTYHMHKVWLIVDRKNKRGRHIYRKAGFQKEGVLREEYYRNGKYHDMIRMSLIDREFGRK